MMRGSTGDDATQRTVVQVNAEEKNVFVEKARQLNMTVSELMRKGAAAYAPFDKDLVELAKAAQASAERSIAIIDEAIRRTAASNARIVAMEEEAKTARQELRAPTVSST